MHNRVTLDAILRIPISEIAALQTDGTVRFQDDDFVVIADRPKRVRWDQTRLAEAVEIIRRDWNDDLAQYVRTELKVAEARYGSWPATIRRLSDTAHAVETGKPTYRIEPPKAELA